MVKQKVMIYGVILKKRYTVKLKIKKIYTVKPKK